MPKTWLLVADAAKARLFEIPKKGANLTEIACYTNPNGRSPGQHPEHGRQGRTQESASSARHAIEPHTSLLPAIRTTRTATRPCASALARRGAGGWNARM